MFSNDQINLVYAPYLTSWDSIKYWSDELHKLIYWLVILFAASTFSFKENIPIIFPVFALAAPGWCFLYLRGIYWWNINLKTFIECSTNLNQYKDEKNIENEQAKTTESKSKSIQAIFRDFRIPKVISFFFMTYCALLQWLSIDTTTNNIKAISLIFIIFVWIIAIIILLILFKFEKFSKNI